MEIRPILSALLRSKTGAILVAVQVALSLAILANALHIVEVRRSVAARPSGVHNESEMFYMVVRNLRTASYNDKLDMQRREEATLRAVPGVVAVAYTNQLPLSRSGNTQGMAVDRKQLNETADASSYTSDESLVKTWGLKLVEGRDFTPDEAVQYDRTVAQPSPTVVIITKALADKAWPGNNGVVGKTIFYGTGEDAKPARIVGVIERLQAVNAQVSEGGEYSTIQPIHSIGAVAAAVYTIRAEPGQRERVIKEAEAAVRKNAGNAVITRVKTMDQDRGERYRADLALSWMLVTVSVLLLLITASGIVGMASLWVQQRRKQIGVRRALGARRLDILRYFLTENFMITSAGVTAGVLLAIGLNALLVSKLEMSRLPAGYLLAGAGVFWALGLVAVYGPAWRAASISPAMATRSA